MVALAPLCGIWPGGEEEGEENGGWSRLQALQAGEWEGRGEHMGCKVSFCERKLWMRVGCREVSWGDGILSQGRGVETD